jgi:hypothetical protein
MPEWWTYRLSDLLLFSPRTYYRLFELYNEQIWPAQLLALAAGLAVLVALRRPDGRGRIIAGIMAASWLWVAWAYLLQRYATINMAARYFAIAFAAEALLITWFGVIRARLQFPEPSRAHERIGIGLFVFALLLQPLIGPLVGRRWSQLEPFGIAPDPTVVATLGLLLLARPRAPRLLLAIPVAWSLVSGATLWAMKSPDAIVFPLIALVVLILGMRKRTG